ncbi:hypothetical protein APHAL10511_000267 [Amanita phalloides]|nr:hypothetical protein APHAL10511_000267 [Amanita phalloides]
MTATFGRSGVLLLGSSSLHSLVPATLISQVDALLDSHRIDDAIELADQRRQVLFISPTPSDADELKYVYQRIGFRCFAETRFDEAGEMFDKGDLDPRVLVGYYPLLRAASGSSSDRERDEDVEGEEEDGVQVFRGVAELMPDEDSIEDLVRNYSPHLGPDTTCTAPGTVELKRVLVRNAEAMLEGVLCRWRARMVATQGTKAQVQIQAKEKGKGKAVDPCFPVVDTVLVKLYAQLRKDTELDALLQDANHVLLSEVEESLIQAGRFDALASLYKQQGQDGKMLDLYAKLIDGEWKDRRIEDPVSDLVRLVQGKKDRSLIQKWALWLLSRHPDRGIKLLISKEAGKRKDRPEEDIALLDRVKAANVAAAQEYLEHLVLVRKSQSAELHTRLVVEWADRVASFLEDESVLKLWRAKASSYASSSHAPNETTFVSYFTSTTPDSEHKRVRVKLILFLAGSALYDSSAVRQRLFERAHVLRIEYAILDARSGDHRAVLLNLVQDVRDGVTAEMYCATGGGAEGVLSRTAAMAVAESMGLGWGMWVAALFGSPGPGAGAGANAGEEVKKRLLRMLLEVHMSDPKGTPTQTARLLSSQAVHLDSVEVLSLIPQDWPLRVLCYEDERDSESERVAFLVRSLRQTVHLLHEGRIVKSISAGQNIEIKDKTWDALRGGGFCVEDAVDEKSALTQDAVDEKSALEAVLADSSFGGNDESVDLTALVGRATLGS